MIDVDGKKVFEDVESMWRAGLEALVAKVKLLPRNDHLDFGLARMDAFCCALSEGGVSSHEVSLMLDGEIETLSKRKHAKKSKEDG